MRTIVKYESNYRGYKKIHSRKRGKLARNNINWHLTDIQRDEQYQPIRTNNAPRQFSTAFRTRTIKSTTECTKNGTGTPISWSPQRTPASKLPKRENGKEKINRMAIVRYQFQENEEIYVVYHRISLSDSQFFTDISRKAKLQGVVPWEQSSGNRKLAFFEDPATQSQLEKRSKTRMGLYV